MDKKFLISIAALAIIGLFAIGPAFATITGSPHDFSDKTKFSWNTTGEICVVCHTPHKAGSAIAPLWNHTVTSSVFTLYSSPTLNAVMAQPDKSSKACLSCHDGTIAIDSFGGQVGTNFIPDDGRKLGTDLSDDHPVSFTYDKTLSDKDSGLFDPTAQTVTALGGKTIDAGMLITHKLECASCHDVHANKGDAATADDMLLVKNTGSALCLTCHNK